MQAKIQKDGEILVIYLKGQIDYETAEPFRQTCLNHLIKENVVFNFGELQFVGSKGITDFTDTLSALSVKIQNPIRFCKVSVEFRRVLEAGELKDLQIYDDEYTAKLSFFNPQVRPQVVYASASSFETEEELA